MKSIALLLSFLLFIDHTVYSVESQNSSIAQQLSKIIANTAFFCGGAVLVPAIQAEIKAAQDIKSLGKQSTSYRKQALIGILLTLSAIVLDAWRESN